MFIKVIFMNNNTYIHKYLNHLINEDDSVVDMTMGNGNDTFYLSKKAKKVYAFDIAIEAINKTKERCKDLNNIIYIQDNHINVDKYIDDEIKLFIFNLGYLPHSDNYYVTNSNDSLIAFKKAYELLKDNGYIIITFYLGHKGGKDEYYLIDDYIEKNNIKILEKYQNHYKIDEPITYIIKK